MIKKTIMLLSVAVLMSGGVALADWNEGDGHKMHYPQLPNEMGWDVNATWPWILGDDWMCTETGQVKDIHFWGSWRHNMEGQILQFNLKIFSDIPADPPQIPYSMPGELLWEMQIPFFEVVVRPMEPFPQGWYSPSTGEVYPDDHFFWYQYNVFLPEQMWFFQREGTIYWLSITAVVENPQVMQWGWKSSRDHWNDDAVWGVDDPPYFWIDIWEPFEPQSLDLAFVINGDCCIPPIRGNVNYDNGDNIDIADLVYLVDYMFNGGPAPPCFEEADMNADGSIDIADLVYLVDYMFNGGPPPYPCNPR